MKYDFDNQRTERALLIVECLLDPENIDIINLFTGDQALSSNEIFEILEPKYDMIYFNLEKLFTVGILVRVYREHKWTYVLNEALVKKILEFVNTI